MKKVTTVMELGYYKAYIAAEAKLEKGLCNYRALIVTETRLEKGFG